MAVITEKIIYICGEIIPMDNWVTERRLVGILEILIKNVGLKLKSNGRCGNCSYRKRKIIVTRMDGSKWGTGIGFGNERSESGKKVGTRFVMISK